MRAKRDNITMVEVYTDTMELLNAIKRQLSAERNEFVTNPQVIACLAEFYEKAHQKGQR